jgi:hypothetical protein
LLQATELGLAHLGKLLGALVDLLLSSVKFSQQTERILQPPGCFIVIFKYSAVVVVVVEPELMVDHILHQQVVVGLVVMLRVFSVPRQSELLKLLP